MKPSFSLLSLWPGFRGVVRYGLWDQLGIALLFGALAQGELALQTLWTNFWSPLGRAVLGVVGFVGWLALEIVAATRLKKYEKSREYDADGEAFLEAQTRYLRGDWFETECCLKAILKKNRADAEALLLLATLYRHIARFDEARRTLAELEKLDAADYWFYEIGLEKAAIQADEREAREEAANAEQAALKERFETEDASAKAEKAVESKESETVKTIEPVAEPAVEPEVEPDVEPNAESNDAPLSLESLERNAPPRRPILKFCLRSGNAPDAA